MTAATAEKTIELEVRGYNEHQILDMMMDYDSNIRILQNMKEEAFVGAGTAGYGIEATMPKPQGETSDPVNREYNRRQRLFRRYGEVTEKVLPIQNFVESPDFEKLTLVDKLVLDLTLAGESQRQIAKVCDISNGSACNRQRKIARIISKTR